jgi:hypothetical protein
MRKGKDPDPDPYPVGPKTCGSGSGSGSESPTLVGTGTFIHSFGSSTLQKYIPQHKGYSVVVSGSVANFYSPLESLAGSDDEEGEEENSQISQDSGIRIPRREQKNSLSQVSHFQGCRSAFISSGSGSSILG